MPRGERTPKSLLVKRIRRYNMILVRAVYVSISEENHLSRGINSEDTS